MQPNILDRYSRTGEGKVIVDIAAARIEELYNNYDRSAPYVKKDLEPDLVDYIVDCVRELGDEPFALQVSLDTVVDDEQMARLKVSINKYFLYLNDLEVRELKGMFRTSLILLVIGVSILTLSVWLNQFIEQHDTVVSRVFAEGLTVAAWVSLWEALATFLINWLPHRRQIKLYQRIAEAPVVSNPIPPTAAVDGV